MCKNPGRKDARAGIKGDPAKNLRPTAHAIARGRTLDPQAVGMARGIAKSRKVVHGE